MLEKFYRIVGIVALIIVGIGSYYFGPFKGKADNPIEEVSEEIIKAETGLDIELSAALKQKDVEDGKE